MNVFNRIISVLLLLFLLGLSALLAVFPAQTLTFAERALGAGAASVQALESANFWQLFAGRAALLVVGVLLCGALLWAELRPRRPRSVRVQTEAGSHVEVTSESVARRLAWHIDQLADVVSVTPEVVPHGRTVDVGLDIVTAPEIDVPMKTEEVVNCAREVIVDRMGLQPGKIRVKITHAPYQDEA